MAPEWLLQQVCVAFFSKRRSLDKLKRVDCVGSADWKVHCHMGIRGSGCGGDGGEIGQTSTRMASGAEAIEQQSTQVVAVLCGYTYTAHGHHSRRRHHLWH